VRSKKNVQIIDKTKILVENKNVCRYQRGNQNPEIEKGQTTQWPNEKAHKRKTIYIKVA
jgi:hypothetical protein